MCNTFLEKIKVIKNSNWRSRARLEIFLKRNDKIILVEGELDAKIYTLLFEYLNIKLSIIRIGTRSNYKILKNTLSSKNIPAILDSDSEVLSCEGKIFYTTYYSIENYFIANDFWKNFMPKEYHNKFFNTIKSINFKEVNIKEKFMENYNECSLDSKIDIQGFLYKNIKGDFIKIIRLFNNNKPIFEIIKEKKDELIKIIYNREMRNFLSQLYVDSQTTTQI